MKRITTFLMFQGQAEEAMTFYQSTFAGAKVMRSDVAGRPATLTIGNLDLLVFDSPPVHDFTFTPSISLFVECDSRDEIDALAARLGEGGQVFMALDNHGFSQRFTWLADRFGVSWQLNLA